MKTYLLHHTPKSVAQDAWALSFSLPFIAASYARAGDRIWYVTTWLTAEQIAARLAILFDTKEELRVHELSRKEAGLVGRLDWLHGRLEDDEADAPFNAPRLMWDALHSVVQTFTGGATAASSGSSRAA